MAIRIVFVALILLTCNRHAYAQVDSAAVDAIKEAERRWAEAWNRRDAGALAVLMAENGHFVTVGGRWLGGRKAFLDHHAPLISKQYMDSTWETTRVEVELLNADVAIAHVTWSMRGDRDPDGTPRQPRTGIFTRVYVRQDGVWRIRASQNTNDSITPVPK